MFVVTYTWNCTAENMILNLVRAGFGAEQSHCIGIASYTEHASVLTL